MGSPTRSRGSVLPFLPLAAALAALVGFGLPLSGECDVPFRRGDVQGDGERNVTDAIDILGHLFLGDGAPLCLDAADTDDNGAVDLTDAVYLLSFLFLGGRALPDPALACGADPTPDPLGCRAIPACPAPPCGGPSGAWVVRMGGSDLGGVEGEGQSSLEVLEDGSAWVAGSMRIFGAFSSAGEACPRELESSSSGIFLARYDPGGRLVWAKHAGGTGRDESTDVALLPDGSAYLTGTFSHVATFGAREPNETVLGSLGDQDVFIARYDASGRLSWVAQAGGTYSDWGQSVAALPDGSAVVTGRFLGSMTFAPGEPNAITLQAVDPPGDPGWKVTEGFVARYGPSGSLAWAKHFGGEGPDTSQDMASLPDGSVVIGGYFGGNISFGEETAAITLVAKGSYDPFLVHFGPDGEPQWADHVATNASGSVSDLEVRDAETVMVLGSVYAKEPVATFDPGGPNEEVLAGAGTFLAVYDLAGSFRWARAIPSGYLLTALPQGSVLVAGVIDEPTAFGKDGPERITLEPTGRVNLFASAYDSEGGFLWARLAPAPDYQVPRAIAAPGDGSLYMTGRFSYSMRLFAGEANETVLESDGSSDVFLARFADLELGGGDPKPCSPASPNGACPGGSVCNRGACERLVCQRVDFQCGPWVSYSNLPGVRIEFPDQPCTFTLSEAQEGIELAYTVIVEEDLTAVASRPSPAESCGAPRPPSGLSVHERIHGDGQLYCLCDVGICLGGSGPAVTLRAGEYPNSFPWKGRNWTGPSDTNSPVGPPFPPGRYSFDLRSRGSVQTARGEELFEVIATFGIELIGG